VDKRGFVIGTGSSLNLLDLTKLKSEVTIASNGFYHSPSLKHWQPTYYCVVDPVYFFDKTMSTLFFKEVTQSVRHTNFIFPLIGKPLVDTIPELAAYKKNYVLFYPSVFGKDLSKDDITKLDLTRPIPGVINVSQMGIMLAMYMGCNPIYLIGMDHDWLMHPLERGEVVSHRFYQDKTFDEYATKLNMNPTSIKPALEGMLLLWKGHERLLKYAKSKGIKIVNATNGGSLDIYERVDYNNLFL
jgi:hypothetical protein